MSKKRHNYPPEFKFETVIEGLRGEKSIAQICRERDITDSLYYKWRVAISISNLRWRHWKWP